MSIFNSTVAPTSNIVIEEAGDEGLAISLTMSEDSFKVMPEIATVNLYKGTHQYTVVSKSTGRQGLIGLNVTAFAQVSEAEFTIIAKAQGITDAQIAKWKADATERS